MRAFHYFMWLSGFGLVHSACAPIVNLAESGDGGGESGTVAEGGGSGTCSSNADCAANEICGFLESQACSATGKCFTAPEATCMAYALGCACDGTEINIACTGLPDGYSTQPLRHTGACTDASPTPDAAPSDSGLAHCVTDSDCPSGEHCGYLISLACSAQGQCMQPPADAGAYCAIEVLSCGCDGADVNVPACPVGLPAGYTSVPSVHTGSCSDATSPPPVDAGRPDASPPGDSGGSDAAPKTCVTDSDCPSGEDCGFLISLACSAQGQCMQPPADAGAYCAIEVLSCGCDGADVYVPGCPVGLPAGYTSVPSVHTGSCSDATSPPPVDAGRTDASPAADSGGSDAAPKPCATDSDCGSGETCGYLASEACSAQGQCVVATVACSPPATITYACACDGTDILGGCAAGLPSDYVPKPFLHTGPCADASPPADSGGSDAPPAPCMTDSDCGAGGVCGFLESLACSASGQCFPAPGAVCEAYLPGCACDGTEINIACTGMPAGYASKPLLHSGVCTDASPPAEGGVDAGGDAGSDACGAGIVTGPDSERCESAGGVCVQFPDPTCCVFVADFTPDDSGCPTAPWAIRCCVSQ
jgi:Cys-rich repeat protein